MKAIQTSQMTRMNGHHGKITILDTAKLPNEVSGQLPVLYDRDNAKKSKNEVIHIDILSKLIYNGIGIIETR